jgi:hypothetical protein
VADLGEDGSERSLLPSRKIFSILPSRTEPKNEFTAPWMALISDFYLKLPLLSKILDPRPEFLDILGYLELCRSGFLGENRNFCLHTFMLLYYECALVIHFTFCLSSEFLRNFSRVRNSDIADRDNEK